MGEISPTINHLLGNSANRIAIAVVMVLCIIQGFPGACSADAETLEPISELLAIVNSPDPEVTEAARNRAILEISRHGNKSAAEVLTGLLSGKHRFMVAICIDNIKDQEAVPILVAGLNKVDEAFIRASLCCAIGNLGGDDAVRAMAVAAKNDGDQWVKRSALYALRMDAENRPEGPAMPVFCDLLGIDSVRNYVYLELLELNSQKALSRLVPELASDNLPVRGIVCILVEKKTIREATDALITLIKKEHNTVLLGEAITALAKVHPPERSDEVAEMLGSYLKNEEIREQALAAVLDTVSDKVRVDAGTAGVLGGLLLPFLDSETKNQRHTAAKIYRKMNYGPAVPKLIALIRREEDSYIREDAMCALAVSVKTRSQVDFMFDWQERHPEDRNMVEKAISYLDTPVALPRLIAVLAKEDDLNAYAAIPVLARMQDNKAARPLLNFIAAGKRPCDRAAEALPNLVGKEDLPHMVEILKQEPCARTEMAQALLHADRQNGFEQIRKLSQAKDKQSVRALHFVLERWHALPKDEPLLSEIVKKEDPVISTMAVQALGRIDSAAAREAVCNAYRGEADMMVREAAARSMSAMRHGDTIQCLVEGYTVTNADPNIIGLNEKSRQALRSVTGQAFDSAEQWAAWVSDGMGLGKSIDDCVKAMAGDNRGLRVLAANQIAAWRDKQAQLKALPFILKQLEAENGSNEEQIAWAGMLAKIQQPAVRDRMLEFCNRSTTLSVRTAFARSLYLSGDGRGVSGLLHCLEEDRGCPREDDSAFLEAVAVATDQPYNYSSDFWLQWSEKYKLAAVER